jgi:cell fate (sporulation/competence/biofilm development) regulator YlbF (YheA/YmcA/DUF963 family)
MQESVPETADADELATKLGEAIAELPEYEAFEEAEQAVAEDEDAQERIDAFNELRREFAMARQTGEATEEDLKELKEAQEELHSMPVMSEYLEAQAALDARLEALNDAISAPIGLDFGEQAGGCCADE